MNAGASPERCGNAHPNIVPYEVFRGRDARYFVVGVGTEALWKKFLLALGVEEQIGNDPRFDSNASRIQNRGAVEDPQTRSRNLIVQLEHAALGTAKSIANPIRLSGSPVSYRFPPPLLGEHTAEILASLGYREEELSSPPASAQ